MNRRRFLTGCAASALAAGCLPLTALAAREAAKKIYPDLAPTPLPPGTYNMRILAVTIDDRNGKIKLTGEWLDLATGQKAPFESIAIKGV